MPSLKPWLWIGVIAVLLTGCTWLPQRNQAGLQVITGESKSSLFLNGQYLDKSPHIVKNVQPGRYTLRIQPDDESLVSYELPVMLRPGTLTVVSWKPGSTPETSSGVVYELEKLTGGAQASLSITTIPDGAIVEVAGRDKAFSPILIDELEPGQYQFALSLPSFDPQQHTVNIPKGYKAQVAVKLGKSQVMELPPVTAVTPTPGVTATESARVASAAAQLRVGAATPAGESNELPRPRVTIRPTGLKINGEEVLRVRAAPSASSQVLGSAPVGQQYAYLGTTENGWYQIRFEGASAWVSAQYAQLEQ